MASHGVLEHAEWFTIRFYYKLAIFKCMHKACNGRLPSTLTNCIAKKRNLSYSIRACDSLLVPRFNTRLMKGSVAYRGTVLWNMLSSRYTDLADTSLCNLVKKLKTSDLFKAAKFNVLSASTACFEHDDLYIIEIKLGFYVLLIYIVKVYFIYILTTDLSKVL